MTACDLVAFALLALFAAFHGLHQWLFMRKQHENMVRLQRYLAVRDEDAAPALQQTIANDQRIEQLGLQHQPPRQQGMNLPPISG
jgi:hypothetical protein